MDSILLDYEISTDTKRLDFDIIHSFLKNSYWSKDIPLEIIKKAASNSLCFGVYFQTKQIGYARIITDYATFAYLADVFIVEEQRNKGLAKALIKNILLHPDLQGLRRWMLATRDAHDLYKQFDFKELAAPDRFMERHFPNLYEKL